MNDIINIISSVGFPILAAIACGYFIKYQMESYKADLRDIRNEHKEEVKSMTDAINNNSMIIQKLCDKLGEDDKKGVA